MQNEKSFVKWINTAGLNMKKSQYISSGDGLVPSNSKPMLTQLYVDSEWVFLQLNSK